jgi:hypothetical protein
MVPLDSGVKAQGPDDLVIRTGIEETGAGDGDDMSYVK